MIAPLLIGDGNYTDPGDGNYTDPGDGNYTDPGDANETGLPVFALDVTQAETLTDSQTGPGDYALEIFMDYGSG